jgi:FkbM family methyltransferase
MEIFELNGVMLGCPEELGSDRITEKLRKGQYEGHEARAAMMRVGPGDKVLELGAGLGYIGALCARAAGAENVTCVEANPDMLPVIRANLDRNGAEAATLIHGAVVGAAHEGETLRFARAKLFWSSAIARGNDTSERVVEVPALKIGDLMKQYRPKVVIMDVEGAEKALFDAPWPAHVRFVMMELHPRRYADTVIKQIVDCLSAAGMTYDPFASRGTVLAFRRVTGRFKEKGADEAGEKAKGKGKGKGKR